MRESVVTSDPLPRRDRVPPHHHRGERLRPVLTIAAAAAGTPGHRRSVRGGVACELVHLGSLYHDDVMDEASTRRGVDTVNAKWGNLQAILAGDFLLSRASGIAASLGTEIAGLLASTIGWLCEGQIEELRQTYDTAHQRRATSPRSRARRHRCSERRPASVASSPAPPRAHRRAHRVRQLVRHRVPDRRRHPRCHRDGGSDRQTRRSRHGRGRLHAPVLRTLALGRSVSDELGDLLGRPLDFVERDKASAIVRSNEGIETAVATARQYVDAAEAV